MENIRGNYIILNNEILPASQYSQVHWENTQQVYEVLRIQKSVPLFLTDHLLRLVNSVEKSGNVISSELEKQIVSGIYKIREANGFIEGNIKILLGIADSKISVCIFFIPHHYPGETLYKEGVSVGLFEATRKNPTAKIVNTSLREEINLYLSKKKLFEVLLIDTENKIREGSRSNVFFISKSNHIITAPDDLVLQGITRKYVLDIIKKHKLPLSLQRLDVEKLTTIQSAFLTGTSPKVIPIKKIGNTHLEINHTFIKTIIEEYDSLIDESINENLAHIFNP